MKKYFLLILFLAAITIDAQNNPAEIQKLFNDHDGAFVLFDNSGGKYFRVNEKRCAEKTLPASTFKIPNSLIGLESGVIPDENFIIKWDGVDRGIKEWNADNSLATAIKYSVVPYYQELARRVGREKMQKFLDEFNYGNKIIGERIDTFWLDNSLKISPDEQIEFLKKFYFYKLPVSKRSIDIVKKIMTVEKYPHAVLKYKTGGGRKEDGTWLGWLVGFIEKENIADANKNDVYFFALNVDGKSFEDASRQRMETVKKILNQLNLIQ